MARLCFVFPHPDDESIACGGVLARYVSEGHDVMVATCTGGEEGENLAGIDLRGEDLATHRRRELAEALRALGVDDHVELGYRDSGMVGSPANDHPDAFHRADLYEAAGRLARLLRRRRPHVVVSDDASGTYGHPDHVKAHRVTERAVAMAADGWWTTPEAGDAWRVEKRYVHTVSHSRMLAAHRGLLAAGLVSPFGEQDVAGPDELPFGTPDEQVTTRVDVRPWFDRKRAAMRAHRSQIGEESFFLNSPDEVARSLFGDEEFVRLSGTGPAAEDDLLAGLRDPADRAAGEPVRARK